MSIKYKNFSTKNIQYNVTKCFSLCSNALKEVGGEMVGGKGDKGNGNQQFINNINGHNNTIVVVNN